MVCYKFAKKTRIRSLFPLVGTIVLFMELGCAAPMTEAVVTRSEKGINHGELKEGDEVLIIHKDDSGMLKETIGTVVIKDGSLARLRHWKQGENFVDIKFENIISFENLKKNLWSVGVSTGRFWAPAYLLGDTPPDLFSTWIGLSPRFSPYSHLSIEASILFGRGMGEFSKWTGGIISFQGYTLVPYTYFFSGLGLIWSLPTEEHEIYFSKFDLPYQSPIKLFRSGIGWRIPTHSRLGVRLEIETGISSYVGTGRRTRFRNTYPILGIKVYLENCIKKKGDNGL